MKKQTLARALLWALVIGTAFMIFQFSAMDGPTSMKTSDGVVQEVIEVVHPEYPTLPPAQQKTIHDQISFIVRKLAHFSEFALLGASLRMLLASYHIRRALPLSWLIGTLYAGTDELHQYFTGTRSPMLQDVAIDSAGTLTGALLITVILILWNRRKAK